MKRIILVFATLFITTFAIFADNPGFTVAIDAGHGGSDPGAVRGDVYESKINLAIALLVGDMLNEHYDIEVLYTRTTDKKLEPEDRTSVANKANICVSIHVNSAYNEQLKRDITDRHGVEVYLRDVDKNNNTRQANVMKNKAEIITVDGSRIDPSTSFGYAQFIRKQDAAQSLSHYLAGYIRDAMGVTANRNTRGVENKSLYMTWQLIVPAVLVEVGYLTNPAEREFMTSKMGQRVLASGIYKGIIKYKTDFDNSREKQEQEQEPPQKTQQQQQTIQNVQKYENTDGIVFKWQIFAGNSKKLPDNDPNFKNLKDCSYYFHNGIYKYTYGESLSYKEIETLGMFVRGLFKDAFIVALKNGKRVTITDEMKFY
jgi:N-acetylmuramoyl-L-alanine amidase